MGNSTTVWYTISHQVHITMYLAAADMASLSQSYSHILNKTENTH